MYKWAISFAILFATLLGVLFGGSSVSAASNYDDLVVITDELYTCTDSSSYEDCSISLTNDWAQYIIDENTYFTTNPTAINNFITNGKNSLLQAFDTGRWAVVQRVSSTGDKKAHVSVVWTEDDSLTVEFQDITHSGGFQVLALTGNDLHVAEITNTGNYLGGDSDISTLNNVQVYNGTTGEFIVEENYSAGRLYDIFFIYADNVTYPVDYEGEQIPDSYTPPTPPLDWTPKINMVQVIDWKITLQDQNFNTFDNVPFTCNDGLTPIIQYDLLNNDTSQNLSQGVFSPTVPFVFESEKYGIETEYKFIGNYYCGIDEGQPTFSGQTTYYFTVNSSGVYIPPTNSCYTDEFPFIDMNGCTGVIEDLLNNLSFGAISFPSWSINNDSCHSLGIIGDWLNVPASSRTICPQFPESIRNIVTPFLTFVLGITILGVIVTKSRSDTH